MEFACRCARNRRHRMGGQHAKWPRLLSSRPGIGLWTGGAQRVRHRAGPAQLKKSRNRASMRLEALWSVRFSSHKGIHGGGVVVIENGKILGGETGYTYIGSMHADRG